MSRQTMSLFFEGCQAPEPMRIAVTAMDGGRPAGNSRIYRLDQPFATVGRAAGNDVRVADPVMSSRHAYLQAFGGRVLCVDLGSRSGVDTDAGRRGAGWVDRGRGVVLGSSLITLDDGTGRPAELAVQADGDGGPDLDTPVISGGIPRVVLDFRAKLFETSWAMRRTIVLVGSAPECGVRLNSDGVAPYHAAFVRTMTGLWAVDLIGGLDLPWRGTVSLNGVPVRVTHVGTGDVVNIGPVAVSARYPGGPRPRAGSVEFTANDRVHAPVESADGETDSEARLRDVVERQAREIERLKRDVGELREFAELLGERFQELSHGERRRPAQVEAEPARLSLSTSLTPRGLVRTLGSTFRALTNGQPAVSLDPPELPNRLVPADFLLASYLPPVDETLLKTTAISTASRL